jgi:SNF2 family DNA or RNA helicase
VIHIRQDRAGFVTVDFSAESAFDGSSHGSELSLGLLVSETTPTEIVADDTGQLGSVLEYITETLTRLGFSFDVDPRLDRALRRFRQEGALVRAAKSSRVRDIFTSENKVTLRRKLLPHQRAAVNHALKVQHDANFSVPGSGKTASALAVFAVLQNDNKVDHLLVIGPASSFEPWENEFKETFGHSPKSVRLIGTRSKRIELLRNLGRVDLILCTYQMAYRDRDSLRQALQAARYFVVLDEAHHIKNINLGAWAQTVLDLAAYAERRMILTGTPAPRSLSDIWSQFTFLWPSEAILGNRVQFEQRLNSLANPAADLQRTLKPFFIRTRKSDLHLPDPKSIFTKIPYRETPRRQRVIIRLLELQTLQEVRQLRLKKADLSIVTRWRKARTLRLLQAASNPALLATTIDHLAEFGGSMASEPALATLLRNYLKEEIPAKISFVTSKTRQLISRGKKVVIWVTFVDNILILERLLRDLNPLKIYGAIPAYDEDKDPSFENRERNIADFKSRMDRPLLIANPAACSESISLHKVCHDAVYLERTFNCGQFLQSMDRIHRVGLPKEAHTRYHIPILECAIERVVDRRLKSRQQVLYRLMNDDMPVFGYDDDSFLVDRDDDLEQIFADFAARAISWSEATY